MRRAAILLGLGLWVAALPPVGAQEPSPFGGAPAAPAGSPFVAEIAQAPRDVPAGATAELRVRLRIPTGHYVYDERTRLEILPGAGYEMVAVRPPASHVKHDPFLDEDVAVHDTDAEYVALLRFASTTTVRAVMHAHGCSKTMCFFPQSDTLVVAVAVAGDGGAPSTVGAAPPAGTAPPAGATRTGPPGTGTMSPESAANARLQDAASKGLFWLLLLAFGAGIATSFTPCVYPMIPITIGIIGARSAGRRSKALTLSLLYVLGIAVTYSALGTSAALTGSLFGSVLQNHWVVLGVALVFAVMAMSLFGAFELQVPSRFATRMNAVQGNGYPGAFLLGLVAGVVASPCIGPVLVAMLAYVASSGNPLLGFGLFFTFALGLGVLFVVLGTFTGVLASLPKSGAWMTRVRIGFGVIFLALALYYLHPLVPHGRMLVPVGIALAALGLVLGALRRIEETEPTRVRWRKAAARAALAAGLYAVAVPLLSRPSEAVAGPQWLATESAGLERASATGKPMLIDFSAAWCVACKELERYTFSDPRVIALAESFVPVRVDATKRTPEILALEKKYGILGLPWVAFVDAQGRILADLTVTGFIDADAMLARMQGALDGRAAGGGR